MSWWEFRGFWGILQRSPSKDKDARWTKKNGLYKLGYKQHTRTDEEGQVSGQATPSKDKDARWTKKNGLYKLGYKQHTRTAVSYTHLTLPTICSV